MKHYEMENYFGTKPFLEKNCKHYVIGTGQHGYRGVAICPFCGKPALMHAKFEPTNDLEKEQVEKWRKEKKNLRDLLPV